VPSDRRGAQLRRAGQAARALARRGRPPPAGANRQRILTQAVRDGGLPDGALARIPAPDAAEPARVVAMREELRERLCAQPDALRRANAPRPDTGRRYADRHTCTS
jgi:hypothetical protein